MANNAWEELIEAQKPKPLRECNCRPEGVKDSDWTAHLWRDGHAGECPLWEYRTLVGDEENY